MEETKIIYHVDDEETPYLVKLPVSPDNVTLADFKVFLNRPTYKFFFKSMDDDFGVVKEEIVDDDAKLPCFNGRVVSWLVSTEGSSVSDSTSQCAESVCHSGMQVALERTLGIGDSRPPSFHASAGQNNSAHPDDNSCTDGDSVTGSRRDQHRQKHAFHRDKHCLEDHGFRLNGHVKHDHHRNSHGYESSSMMSSDIETTSFLDSEEDVISRISSTTDDSSISRIHSRHRRRRKRHRLPPMSRTSSFSSITDSTMSLNIITVTLNMDTVNFLGISIVGQSNKGGDGGIYVGSIMKGGAVALDGRIEPGDMILQVNDINFENMSNDDAVRVLREVVQKPGPIKLVVAKCWDPNPRAYFTIPKTEPVRPIDPGAWIAHTTAMRVGDYAIRPSSVTTLTSTSSSIASSIPDSERHYEDMHLTVNCNMLTVAKAMASPDSGLEIRDRMWLKITIPNAFIGADVVDWLNTHVDGFQDRREARKYASHMLKMGYIRHTVNKITFSEQCYYVFGDLCGGLSTLKLNDDDIGSDAGGDMLAPLPPPATSLPWGSQMPYSGNYIPQTTGYLPMPFSYTNETASFSSYARADEGLQSGGSGGSSNGSERCREKLLDAKEASPIPSESDSDVQSQQSIRRVVPTNNTKPPPSAVVPNRLDSVPPNLSSSRQSFRMAMGNPGDETDGNDACSLEDLQKIVPMVEDDILAYRFSDRNVV